MPSREPIAPLTLDDQAIEQDQNRRDVTALAQAVGERQPLVGGSEKLVALQAGIAILCHHPMRDRLPIVEPQRLTEGLDTPGYGDPLRMSVLVKNALTATKQHYSRRIERMPQRMTVDAVEEACFIASNVHTWLETAQFLNAFLRDDVIRVEC